MMLSLEVTVKGNNIKYTFREKDKGKDEDLKKSTSLFKLHIGELNAS